MAFCILYSVALYTSSTSFYLNTCLSPTKHTHTYPIRPKIYASNKEHQISKRSFYVNNKILYFT